MRERGMEKRRIGSLEVSTVGLGTNNFGGRIDYDSSAAVVNAALEVGINFFDTADIYGGTRSEEFLGRALAERRNEVLIATKFGNAVDPEKKGAHPDYVARAVEDSLRRLGTDRIDLYILHTPDPTVPIADTLGALDKLVREGKVREIGCSNFSVDQLREADAAVASGSARFTSIQNEYSLIHREPESGMLALCEELGIAFVPYFPLASGLLTGKYRKDQAIPEGTRLAKGPAGDRLLTERNLDLVERLVAFSESRGHTILELAFSWLLAHPVVPSVIAGATSAKQVIDNAEAAGWKLTEEEMGEVDRLLVE
jgi:aryl-alcohol dehydrogenase-like predicted oxidoreductase